MKYKPNSFLKNPSVFRLGFFLILCLSVLVNSFLLKGESHFFILYIFSVIFLGIGYYNKSNLFLVFFTMIVVLCRYLLIPEMEHDFLMFIIYLCTYLVITFISVGLMRKAQKINEENIELTKALANALDSRDAYTLDHSENVSKYAVEIAKEMGISKEVCEVIRVGSLLHDIGKIGIPEYILTKPGRLTDNEYSIVKEHPNIGYEIIKHVENYRESGVLDIVLYHHERFDGKGYPRGLKGYEIPLPARIVAIADTFDAMTSHRIYREEIDLETTLNEIEANKGIQFDPDIVDVFLKQFKTD